MPEDFYDLFDVPSNAEQDDIESAYLRLVKEYHPDRNSSDNAEEQFKTVEKAHDVLTDPKERRKYDELGHVRYVRSYIASGSLDGFEFTATEPDPEDPVITGPTAENDTEKTTDSTPSTETGQDTTTPTSSSSDTPTSTSTSTSTTTSDTSDTTSSDVSTEKEPIEIPFKPKVHRSIIHAVSAILTVLFIYVYGAFSFALSERSSFFEFLGDVITNPAIAFGLSVDIQNPREFISAIGADPLANIGAILFLIGLIALPVVAATIVTKLGGNRPSLWLYVVGTLPPALTLTLGYATGSAIPPALATLAYLVAPVATVLVFITDIMSYILKKYAEFYVAHYRLKYRRYFG